jgi:hypothetical protein
VLLQQVQRMNGRAVRNAYQRIQRRLGLPPLPSVTKGCLELRRAGDGEIPVERAMRSRAKRLLSEHLRRKR